MKEIYIIGSGTYGEVMYELAEECGYKVLGFFDDDAEKSGEMVMDTPVIGRFCDLDDSEVSGKNFIVAIGNNPTRHKIMENINKRGGITPTLIHPTAQISKSAKIGKGVYIQMGAVIWTKAELGDYVIISPNTVVAHHSKIGHSSLISTSCAVGASVEVGEYCFFGFGSIVITGIKKVGKNVMLGAGTTVIKDTEDNVLMVGSPARVVREREPVE